MQYVDEGRLDLDAPLARYLPAFSGRGRDEVSAWHVLTHTSGLPDLPMATLRARRPSYQQLLSEALGGVPAWEPGSRYEYNSAAWVLLSESMARLSGMAFATALRTRLTQPLGMVDTTFDARYARARIRPMDGFGIGNRIVGELLLRFLARAQLPGGGLFGTVPDLLRLGQALLPPPPEARNGEANVRVLSRSAIARMSERQTDGIPHVAEDGSSSYVAQALGWRKPGPGWPASEAAITHGGISGSRIWVDPEHGFAYAFLTNLWAAPDDPAIEILDEVYRALGRSAA
jgi:CubicO group peptidase (beta-lactamase class C family)